MKKFLYTTIMPKLKDTVMSEVVTFHTKFQEISLINNITITQFNTIALKLGVVGVYPPILGTRHYN